MVIVPRSEFQPKVLQYIQDHNPQAKHMGYHKTLKREKLEFYWEGVRKAIKKLVKKCDVC